MALGLLILTSCSSRRIEMIEDTFGIALPENYDILKNTTESTGFEGADFEVNVELKFKVKEFEELKNELSKIDSLRVDGESRYFKNIESESASLEIDEENRLLKFQFIHI